ncbi:MAG: DUF4011 domain-containing protein [Actinobacteria bacterium]|nr:DUF4011 domain-containing protein [Actinomycetota bacterium]
MGDPTERPEVTDLGMGRKKLVVDAVERWIARLIDLSRRNSLLYYRPLKVGTLELTDCDEEELNGLLHGRKLRLSSLVEPEEEEQASGKLQEIRRKALANLEEKGLETLFLAVGMATWDPADEGRPPESPVLLLPMEIEGRGRETRSLSLRRSGDAQINPVLLHILNAEMDVGITEEGLLSVDAATDTDKLDPSVVFSRLNSAASGVKGFRTDRKIVLGNFSFQKMAMVKDLRENLDQLVTHDLIAAIAGDPGARESVLSDRLGVDLEELDLIPADEEFLVLDADSSQQRVIRCVQSSQDGVIHGPPGTGKSQTISNLIAALAVQGKRVLFVAEKRAALEVVLRRLENLGLGHLALDLHGATTTRREVMGRISHSLDIIRESTPADVENAHRRFEDRRIKLNEHARRMHQPQPPAGLGIYEIQGRLLRLSEGVKSTLRWSESELLRLDRVVIDEVKDLLLDLGSAYRSLFLRNDDSPWNGAVIPSGERAQEVVRTVRELLQYWPQMEAALSGSVREAAVPPPMTVEGSERAATIFGRANSKLDEYEPDLFQHIAGNLVEALEPASGGVLSRTLAYLFNGRYRAARKLLLGVRKGGNAPSPLLLEEARAALEIARAWGSLGAVNDLPKEVPSAESLERTIGVVKPMLLILASALEEDLLRVPLPSLRDLFRALASDDITPHRLPRLFDMERRLTDLGMGDVVIHLRETMPPSNEWGSVVEHAWLSSMIDVARQNDSQVAGFDGRAQDALVDDFKQLDRLRLDLAVARVRRMHAETAVAARNAHPGQDQIVSRQARLKTRHQPLRKTFEEASDVLTALRPCWMASPLTVSQLLGPARAFDIVIFDEASQVLPHDSIPSLMRAGKTVVAGDRNQLPPTTFFFYSGDEDESSELAGPAEGFESLLDLLSAFLDPWSLDWHYRSRSEELISFSNRHIYKDRLVTFPSVGESQAVTHHLIPWRPVDGQEDSSSEEVSKVVDLVIDHAEIMLKRAKPERETLGVIAMGIKHARRIEGALDEALRERPDLDEFFDLNVTERFFIKNLERVQGDERDAIILSIGYGKDRSGRLPYRFGPLLTEGGERRLNVAVTRARQRMIVVSSFSHVDMDPGRSSRRGVELLRLYLQYAESNGKLLGDRADTGVALNAFEEAVKIALEERGLTILPQWGASRYRIDLVAVHPEKPGRPVLAIECDGASYHSAPTARDRDRLRQQHLEALGWRFHRIWSTDWFMRRDEEIARTLRAFDEAVTIADRRDGGEPDPVPREGPRSPLDHGPEHGGGVRSARPNLRKGLPIANYTDAQLTRLLEWIESDARLRTDQELIQAMVEELGYRRRGARIEERLRQVITRHR